jgi:hypothetical protein
MGIKEDRDEINNSGWRAALKHLMRTKDEGYIKLDPAGWRGEEAAERPAPGTGPFIYFKRGYPPVRFSNSTPDDQRSEELGRWEV